MAPHAAMGPSPPATSAAPYAPNPSQQAPRVDPYDVVAAVLAAEFTAFFAEARRPTSPMLDYLFRALRRERTSTFAESFIWATWMAHERDAVIATMDVGARAHEKGEHDAARAHYSRVIEMDETYAEGWNRRAAASYAKGDLNAALRDINEVLRREPRHWGAWTGRGLAHMARNQFMAAAKCFEAAIEVHPKLAQASVGQNLAVCRMGLEANNR